MVEKEHSSLPFGMVFDGAVQIWITTMSFRILGRSLGGALRARPRGSRWAWTRRSPSAGNELGEGGRIDCTHREGLGSDGKAGNEGRGREVEGEGGRHLELILVNFVHNPLHTPETTKSLRPVLTQYGHITT